MHSVILLLFPALIAYAAASDLLTMKIPNWLTGAVALAFPLAALAAGMGWSAVAAHAGLGAILLLVGAGMFAAGWMGGGDAKLLAAIALWFGPTAAAVDFLFVTALAGGTLTLALVLFRRFPALPAFTLSWVWLQRLYDKRCGIPYGIAIAAGALPAYPHSPIARGLLALAG